MRHAAQSEPELCIREKRATGQRERRRDGAFGGLLLSAAHDRAVWLRAVCVCVWLPLLTLQLFLYESKLWIAQWVHTDELGKLIRYFFAEVKKGRLSIRASSLLSQRFSIQHFLRVTSPRSSLSPLTQRAIVWSRGRLTILPFCGTFLLAGQCVLHS